MALEVNKVVYAQGPVLNGGATFTDGSEGEKTLVTAGTNGLRIDAITISTNDAADNSVTFNIYDETTTLVYKWVVPIDDGSGITTTFTTQKPETDALQSFCKAAAIDGSGVRHLYLEAAWILKAQPVTDLTASDAIYVFVQGWQLNG